MDLLAECAMKVDSVHAEKMLEGTNVMLAALASLDFQIARVNVTFMWSLRVINRPPQFF